MNTLQFCGAAGTVTGSKHLLNINGKKILMDCGLFQGLKNLRLRNWEKTSFVASEIDAVLLSHAHIDHSGYLPRLVKEGFSGPIYCTPGTRSLARILLPDSAQLQEEEAHNANRFGYSKHKPALPLYTLEDSEKALSLLRTKPYGSFFPLVDGVEFKFRHAGHILGAATIELNIDHKKNLSLVFSGDLGRPGQPILRNPEMISETDILLLESTYGDRIHPRDPDSELTRVIQEAIDHERTMLVPAFTVGRVQELIWRIRKLEDEKRIPVIPVFIDSPMAISANEIYMEHHEDHNLAMDKLEKSKDGPLATHNFHLVRTTEESKSLNHFRGPLMIIAGSGMATGGRILYHMKMRMSDERTTIVLVGFQASGTRGRKLQEGVKTVSIHGQEVYVRAHIETIDGLSAHADRDEILHWLGGFQRPPQQVFLVHGEEKPAQILAQAIREKYGWQVDIAQDQEMVDLKSYG